MSIFWKKLLAFLALCAFAVVTAVFAGLFHHEGIVQALRDNSWSIFSWAVASAVYVLLAPTRADIAGEVSASRKRSLVISAVVAVTLVIFGVYMAFHW